MFTKPVMVPAMSSHQNQLLLTPTRQFPWQLYQSQTPPWWVQLRQWIPQGFLWRTTRLCLFYRRMVVQRIKRYKNALYLSVNVFSSKVLGTLVFLSPTAILRRHPSHAKVKLFAGQNQYLYLQRKVEKMKLNKNEPVKPANNLSIFVDTYILYSICCCYLNVTRLLLWIEFSIWVLSRV